MCGGYKYATKTYETILTSKYNPGYYCRNSSRNVANGCSDPCGGSGLIMNGQSRIVHDVYLNNGQVPTPINQYVTYCTLYSSVASSNHNISCGGSFVQYCSSGYGAGSCSNVSATNCSILNFRNIEISTYMPSYFTLFNRSDSGNWHVASYQHCINGNEVKVVDGVSYNCSTGVDNRYRKDSSNNIHEWYVLTP